MPRELLMIQNSFQWEAIEGQTLQFDNAIRSNARDLKIEGQTYQNYTDNTKEYVSTESKFNYIYSLSNLKANTIYTLSYEIKSSNEITTNNNTILFRIEKIKADSNAIIMAGFTGTVDNIYRKYKLTFNTGSDTVQTKINLRNAFNNPSIGLTENTLSVRNLVLLEGDYTNGTMITELPTSINEIESVAEREKEGDLYPVKLTNKGKNLLDLSTFTPVSTSDIQASISGNVITIKGSKTSNVESVTDAKACNLKVYLEEGKTYSVSFKSDGVAGKISGTDTVEIFLMLNGTTNKKFYEIVGQLTFTIPEGCSGYYYIRFDVNSGDKTHKFWDIQVEEGDTVTNYEPYLKTTTEIPLPQPLRSLPNGVCDEVVGNKLIQRVGVFNASKNYSSAKWMGSLSPFLEFDFMQGFDKQNDNVYCNTLPYKLMSYNSEHNEKGFSTQVGFRIKPFEEDNKSRKEYETWLEENETIIYYELVNPIVHELNIPPISIAKGSNTITTINNIKPNLRFKYKKLKNKVR